MVAIDLGGTRDVVREETRREKSRAERVKWFLARQLRSMHVTINNSEYFWCSSRLMNHKIPRSSLSTIIKQYDYPEHLLLHDAFTGPRSWAEDLDL